VVAIGPPIMMRAVAGVTKPFGTQTIVSLNPIMIDGTYDGYHFITCFFVGFRLRI